MPQNVLSIVRRSKKRFQKNARLAVAVKLDDGRQPEIANFDVSRAAQKYIAELEVAVNDILLVHVLDRIKRLLHVEARLALGDPLPLFYNVENRLRDIVQ